LLQERLEESENHIESSINQSFSLR